MTDGDFMYGRAAFFSCRNFVNRDNHFQKKPVTRSLFYLIQVCEDLGW